MKIPFLDLEATYRELKPELDSAYHRVMDSGYYILGPEVASFEKEYAAFCDTKYCVGVSNGLDALVLLLKAYGIGPGDEVIVPSNTFIATWLAVSGVGATPVSVVPESGYYNIDPLKILPALTSKTKAIMPVHLYGHPADMNEIMALANKKGLLVIEDAAQAQGATYHDRPAGGLGDAAGFSFYPGKNLGAFGDAGAITTSNFDIYEKLRTLRNYGSPQKYVHKLIGNNFRLDELQAAFLRVKLKKINEWNARRRDLVKVYESGLQGLEVICPKEKTGCKSAWHLYVIQAPQRDALQKYLHENGIITLVHYPISSASQEAYLTSPYREDESYNASSLLSLPLGPHMPKNMVEKVCEMIRSFYAGR